jgi:hypothetical protein
MSVFLDISGSPESGSEVYFVQKKCKQGETRIVGFVRKYVVVLI